MNKKIIATISLILFSFINFAQSKVDFKNQNTGLQIQTIDKNNLNDLLNNSKAKINVVVIFSNDCGGTSYMLEDIKKCKNSFGDNVNIILCSSEKYKRESDLRNIIKQHNIQLSTVYFIDSEMYKYKKSDSRQKGLNFRNDICEECKNDIIGFPYYIIYEKSKIIKNRYHSKIDFFEFIGSTIKDL